MRNNFRDADTCIFCKLCLYNSVNIHYTEYFCNLDGTAPLDLNGRLDLETFVYNRDIHAWKNAHWVEDTDVCDEFVKD